MIEIRFCRNCTHWCTTRAWKGNCLKHPWEKSKYSQEASAGDCPDYVDKFTKYEKEFAELAGMTDSEIEAMEA